MSQRHPGLPLARCGAFRRGSSALHKHARAAELGAATRLANRAPGAAEPMTPSRKRCVPRRPEPCEARRGHPARLTLPWSPWRYHCHCSPPTALGQLRGGGSGACTTRTDQRGRVVREGRHLIEPLATTALERAIEERSKVPGWQACSRTEQVSIALPAPLWEST